MSKKYLSIFIISVLLLFLNFTEKEDKTPDHITSIVNDVKNKYCPDNRLSVFNVTTIIENKKLILKGQVLSIESKSELIKQLEQSQNFEIEDSVIVLPHPELENNVFGIIRISVAQLRKLPGVESEMISQAIMGSEVRILKKDDINNSNWWYYCRMEDNYLGWMTKSSIQIGDKKFIDNWREKKKLIVTSNYAQVWEKPTENSLPVSDLVRGNKLIKINDHNDWYEVELADGRTGYVQTNQVEEEEVLLNNLKDTAEDIIKTASSFIGIPYLWGGTSVKGFDCSGFTQSVFKFNDIKLPRDANMQVTMGNHVPLTDSLKFLQPADLLFWGSSEDTITHVGIYIGDNRYIHSDGLVRINSFNPKDKDYSKYRHQYLQAARRIL